MSTGTGGGGPGGDGRRGGGVGPVTCESRHEPGSRHWQPAVTDTKKYLFAMASSNRHGVAGASSANCHGTSADRATSRKCTSLFQGLVCAVSFGNALGQ